MAAPAARSPGIFARIEEGQQWVANLYANVFLMEHWGKDGLVRLGTGPPSRRGE